MSVRNGSIEIAASELSERYKVPGGFRVKSQEFVHAVLARNAGQREIVVALGPQYDSPKPPANDVVRAEPWASKSRLRPQQVLSVKPVLGQRAFDMGMLLDLPVPDEKRLKSLFELTHAEARLAQCLACGDSVEEAAQKLNVKMTTARTQLAAIFAKTDTRRQAKLVAILAHIAHVA